MTNKKKEWLKQINRNEDFKATSLTTIRVIGTNSFYYVKTHGFYKNDNKKSLCGKKYSVALNLGEYNKISKIPKKIINCKHCLKKINELKIIEKQMDKQELIKIGGLK